jgi:hypothetical protein
MDANSIGRFEIDVPALSGIDLSRNAFTFDAGAFLDFTLLPILNLGVHAAYNHLALKQNSWVV